MARVGNRVRALAWAAMLAAVAAASRLDQRLGLACPAPTLACRAAGLLLLATVLRAAAVTGRYLAVYGKSRPDLPRGEVDRLVTVGPYSCMRHPMHLFLSMFPLSIALLLASPTAVAVAVAEMLLVLALAVTVDERESLERFGRAYLEYRRRVPAFNLSPSCLAKALLHRPPKRRQGEGG